MDASGKIVDASTVACKLVGRVRSEVAGLSFFRCVESPNPGGPHKLLSKIRRGSGKHFPCTLKSGRGKRTRVSLAVRPAENARFIITASVKGPIDRARGKGESPTGLLGAFDVLFAHAEDRVIMIDREGRVVQANPAWEKTFGLADGECRGRLVSDLLPHDEHYASRLQRLLSEVVKKKESIRLEARAVTIASKPEGGPTYWDWTLQPILNARGSVEFILFTSSDVTDRKRAEDEVQRINRALRTLAAGSRAILRIKREFDMLTEVCRVIVENGAYQSARIGLLDGHAIGPLRLAARSGGDNGITADFDNGWSSLVMRDTPVAKMLKTGKTAREPLAAKAPPEGRRREAMGKPGSIATLHLPLLHSNDLLGVLSISSGSATAFAPEEKLLLEVLASEIADGIIARRSQRAREEVEAETQRVQDALAERERRYQTLFELSPSAILLQDLSGKILEVNDALCRIFQYTRNELVGNNVRILVPPKDIESVDRNIDEIVSGTVLMHEVINLARDGTPRQMQLREKVVPLPDGGLGILVASNDVTDRARAEEALKEQDRISQSLLRLSKQLERATSYTGVMDAALAELKSTTAYQSIWVYLYTRDMEYAEALVSSGKEFTPDVLRLKIKGDRVLEATIATKDVLVIPEASVDSRSNQDLAEQHAIHTIIHVPIMIFDRHIGHVGTATFGDEGVRVPSEMEKEFLAAMASHMAVALDRIHSQIERDQAETALRDSEERYRTLIYASPDAITVTDLYGRITFISPKTLELFHIPPGTDVIGQSIFDWVAEADRDRAMTNLQSILARGTLMEQEFTLQRTGGIQFQADVHAALIHASDGSAKEAVIVTRDITDRIRALEDLRRLSHVVEQSPVSVVVTDTTGSIVYVNPKFSSVTGYAFSEVIGKNPRILKSGETPSEEYSRMWDALKAGQEWHGEFHNRRKNGELFWEAASISPIRDALGDISHFVAVKEDITDKKMRDEQIRQSLAEKELLLKEIHHRVKNNMQVISSLLSLESQGVEDPRTREMFETSKNRIRSMALVHDKLYRSQNMAAIDFGEYLAVVTTELQHSYGRTAVNCTVTAEKLVLSVDTAIPCGLIVNELVSNAFKHGFPNNRRGEVAVSLHRRDSKTAEMVVQDNGVGLPKGMNLKQTGTLGMALVSDLVEQISGTLIVASTSGTTITIVFPALLA